MPREIKRPGEPNQEPQQPPPTSIDADVLVFALEELQRLTAAETVAGDTPETLLPPSNNPEPSKE